MGIRFHWPKYYSGANESRGEVTTQFFDVPGWLGWLRPASAASSSGSWSCLVRLSAIDPARTYSSDVGRGDDSSRQRVRSPAWLSHPHRRNSWSDDKLRRGAWLAHCL